MTDKLDAARQVAADQEQEQVDIPLHARYYVRTPTFHYFGTLVAVTAYVFVFKDHSTILESGPLPDLFKNGKAAEAQDHTGAGPMYVDRAGSVLIRMPE